MTVLNIVGITTATVILVTGIAILLNFLLPPYFPGGVRYFVGSLMVLYGVFRGTMLWVKYRSAKADEEKL